MSKFNLIAFTLHPSKFTGKYIPRSWYEVVYHYSWRTSCFWSYTSTWSNNQSQEARAPKNHIRLVEKRYIAYQGSHSLHHFSSLGWSCHILRDADHKFQISDLKTKLKKSIYHSNSYLQQRMIKSSFSFLEEFAVGNRHGDLRGEFLEKILVRYFPRVFVLRGLVDNLNDSDNALLVENRTDEHVIGAIARFFVHGFVKSEHIFEKRKKKLNSNLGSPYASWITSIFSSLRATPASPVVLGKRMSSSVSCLKNDTNHRKYNTEMPYLMGKASPIPTDMFEFV